jgi:hypothetical protein
MVRNRKFSLGRSIPKCFSVAKVDLGIGEKREEDYKSKPKLVGPCDCNMDENAIRLGNHKGWDLRP